MLNSIAEVSICMMLPLNFAHTAKLLELDIIIILYYSIDNIIITSNKFKCA